MSKIRAFTMPKWGIEMTEGLLAQWMVGEGDAVAKGQVLALVETDKITNEIEAEFDAVLRRAVAKAGDTLPVGALLGVFAPAETPEAEVQAFLDGFTPANAPDADAAPADAAPTAPAPVVTISPDLAISPRALELAVAKGVDAGAIKGSGRDGRITLQDVAQAALRPSPPRALGPVDNAVTTEGLDRYFASPLAKRIALQNDIDLGAIAGGGPHGRIQQKDVLAAIAARAPTPATTPPASPVASRPDGEVEVIRMSPMRKAIAKRLTASKITIPHFYLRARVAVDAIDAMRRRLSAETGVKISLNDMLVRACAMALQSVPDVNIQVHGDDIHRFSASDISVAVATERGLLTPIVRAAEAKTPGQIAQEVRDLAARARAGQLKPEAFEGGSFSVSNLGMYGVEQFDAIINQPQGAILAVGAARPELVASADGFRIASVLNLSLSLDHRAIDGAVGGRFLAELKSLIEEPEVLA